jgi:hypothetical protein
MDDSGLNIWPKARRKASSQTMSSGSPVVYEPDRRDNPSFTIRRWVSRPTPVRPEVTLIIRRNSFASQPQYVRLLNPTGAKRPSDQAGAQPARRQEAKPLSAKPNKPASRSEDGGARRSRTDDILLAKQALYQLSYGPISQWTLIPGWPGQTRTADLTLIRRTL